MPQVQKIIESAMFETGILSAGDSVSAEDAAWGLDKLQRMIDQWDADRSKIYTVTFLRFTLVPNLAPHTIGPGGTFNVTQRPVKLVSANVVLNPGSSEVEYPLEIWNDQQWADVRIKNLSSNISRGVYYEPQFPLGSLYFWPVPTSVNDVKLEVWNSLTQAINQNDILQLPPGYWEAMVLTLALKFCGSFRVSPPPTLASDQIRAIRVIQGNNSAPPLIRTDGGISSGKRTGRPDFYFPTGEPW